MHQERGNVRYLWIMVGAYLAYLGYQQFQLLIQGESTHPVIGVIAGIVFIAVGGMVLWREWDAWRWSQAHKDDPEDGADALPDASDTDDDPSYEDDEEDLSDDDEDPPYEDDEEDPSDEDDDPSYEDDEEDLSDDDEDPPYEDDEEDPSDEDDDPSDEDGEEETDGDPVPDRDDPEDAP